MHTNYQKRSSFLGRQTLFFETKSIETMNTQGNSAVVRSQSKRRFTNGRKQPRAALSLFSNHY